MFVWPNQPIQIDGWDKKSGHMFNQHILIACLESISLGPFQMLSLLSSFFSDRPTPIFQDKKKIMADSIFFFFNFRPTYWIDSACH